MNNLQHRNSPARPVAAQAVQSFADQACFWDHLGPMDQHLPAQRGQAYPLRQSLAIHFPSQNSQLNEPEELIFRFSGVQATTRLCRPVRQCHEL